MDIETLEINVKTLKETLDYVKNNIELLENEIVELKNNKQCKWKPKIDEVYYRITGVGVVESNTNFDSKYDKNVMDIGNVFKTKEEAEFIIEKLKVIEELRQFEEPKDREWDNNNHHFYIYYDTIVKTITISYCSRDKSNDIYFESKEIAEQAIKSVGEDRIKKYYFEV